MMKLLWGLLAVMSLSSCCADLDKEKISAELNKDLHVGDSREKAESVLRNHQIGFSYDEYQNLYSSNIRGKDCAFDKSILVTIYLNKSGVVSKIEVSNSYTFL